MSLCYKTKLGEAYCGDSLELIDTLKNDSVDLVVDIFGGSNTTGATAEKLGRKWKSFELNREYVASSSFRFVNDIEETTQCYEKIINEELVDFTV